VEVAGVEDRGAVMEVVDNECEECASVEYEDGDCEGSDYGGYDYDMCWKSRTVDNPNKIDYN
tara:strand:- start:2214 stop:2399 length:186 start_codon:yes stop_codon:yes gene_type:complete